jgi:DnaJ-class molecular chaperone
VAINPEVDLYAVLNISADATADEIKRAYRELARQVHPDMQDKQGTAQLFRQVQEAYEILSDPSKRAAYDRQRVEAGLSPKSIFQWKMQPSRTELSVDMDEQVVYLLFDISAGQSEQARGRQALNLSLVLDRSTSMQGSRLEQTKASAQRMIDSLSGRLMP